MTKISVSITKSNPSGFCGLTFYNVSNIEIVDFEGTPEELTAFVKRIEQAVVAARSQ